MRDKDLTEEEAIELYNAERELSDDSSEFPEYCVVDDVLYRIK